MKNKMPSEIQEKLKSVGISKSMEFKILNHLKEYEFDPDDKFWKERGDLYCIQSILGGPFKFGIAKNYHKRIEQIQIVNPFKLNIFAILFGRFALLERAIQIICEADHYHNEWYYPTERVKKIIEKLIHSKDNAIRKTIMVF